MATRPLPILTRELEALPLEEVQYLFLQLGLETEGMDLEEEWQLVDYIHFLLSPNTIEELIQSGLYEDCDDYLTSIEEVIDEGAI